MTGAVHGMVGTSQIVLQILSVALGRTGECYLMNEDGRFLAHKEPRRILAENISRSDSFKKIFAKRDPRQTYLDCRSIEVLGTSRKVAGTDWYIVVEQNRDEAFAAADRLKQYIYLTIFVYIGCAFLMTWAIARNIIRPIRMLSRTADKSSNSEFEKAIVKSRRRDEIGMLYRAFENMALKLRKRQHQLEKKVDLREAELKETDVVLKQIRRIAERSERFSVIGRLGARRWPTKSEPR